MSAYVASAKAQYVLGLCCSFENTYIQPFTNLEHTFSEVSRLFHTWVIPGLRLMLYPGPCWLWSSWLLSPMGTEVGTFLVLSITDQLIYISQTQNILTYSSPSVKFLHFNVPMICQFCCMYWKPIPFLIHHLWGVCLYFCWLNMQKLIVTSIFTFWLSLLLNIHWKMVKELVAHTKILDWTLVENKTNC